MVTLTNVPPASTPLRCEARQPYSLAVKFLLVDDTTPANLTGHVLTLRVKQKPHLGGAVVITKVLDLVDPLLGWARLNLQGSETDLATGDYDYSLAILTENSYSAIVLKGTFTIVDNASAVPGAPYVGTGAVQTVQLTLQNNNSLTVKIDHLPIPELIMGAVTLLPYYAAPKAEILGSYPRQVLNLWLPGPGNPDHGVAPSYENVPPGAAFAAHWDGANWKIGTTTVTARPTARTDVYFILLGGTSNPAWMLSTDKRIP